MKYLSIVFGLIFFCGFQVNLAGQDLESKAINVKYINEVIKPDGILDEAVWNTAIPVSGMNQNFPNDSLKLVMIQNLNLYTPTTHYMLELLVIQSLVNS